MRLVRITVDVVLPDHYDKPGEGDLLEEVLVTGVLLDGYSTDKIESVIDFRVQEARFEVIGPTHSETVYGSEADRA